MEGHVTSRSRRGNLPISYKRRTMSFKWSPSMREQCWLERKRNKRGGGDGGKYKRPSGILMQHKKG